MGIRNELKVFGNNYPTPNGTAMRNYIDVNNLAKVHGMAVNRLLNDELEEQTELFNLGQGRGVSVKEVIDNFEEVNGVKVNWSYAPRRLGDLPILYADTSKAERILHWKAETSLAKSLENAWHWEKYINKNTCKFKNQFK